MPPHITEVIHSSTEIRRDECRERPKFCLDYSPEIAALHHPFVEGPAQTD
jgi:hypothetical protein